MAAKPLCRCQGILTTTDILWPRRKQDLPDANLLFALGNVGLDTDPEGQGNLSYLTTGWIWLSFAKLSLINEGSLVKGKSKLIFIAKVKSLTERRGNVVTMPFFFVKVLFWVRLKSPIAEKLQMQKREPAISMPEADRPPICGYMSVCLWWGSYTSLCNSLENSIIVFFS